MTLPSGWSESKPGGMAINPDPIYGGIIDRGIVDQRWFVIHNDPELPDVIDELDSRDEALAAFREKLHTHVSSKMAEYAWMVGVGQMVVADQVKAIRPGAHEQQLPTAELTGQIKSAIDAGVSPDDLAAAIWGAGSTWASVAASYARTGVDLSKAWSAAGFELACLGGDSYGLCKQVDGVAFVLTDYMESRLPNPDFRLHAAAYSSDGEFIDIELPDGNLAFVTANLDAWTSMAHEHLDSAEQSHRMKGPGM